nr:MULTISPECIES: hypothetical protein [Providencia]
MQYGTELSGYVQDSNDHIVKSGMIILITLSMNAAFWRRVIAQSHSMIGGKM